MSQVDFDQLSKAAYASGTDNKQALDQLWVATFKLEQWYFIARGAAPNVRPYIGHKDGNVPMIFVFTDEDRLEAAARELKLLGTTGTIPVMTIPTKNIVSYLQQFAQYGVKGVWFNPNGQGYFSPLENLPKIKARVDSLNIA